MKGKELVVSLLSLGSFLLLWGGQLRANPAEEPIPLYVIERDTLQTRNFTPVVNHHAMVVNLGNRPVSLTIVSPIPPGLFKKGKFYPAFLEDSLLPGPLFAPLAVSPNKTSYLPQPDIVVERNGATSFVWKEVNLPEKEAVIAQYDNYFGKPDRYWKEEGLDLCGLKVHTKYGARRVNRSSFELSFAYRVINGTGGPIKQLSMAVFVPVKRLTQGKEAEFLNLTQICTSPNIEASRVTRADGFAESAYGVNATLWPEDLEADGELRFSLRLAGTREAKEGKIWPLITVSGRSIQAPVWPATRIEARQPINLGQFSYLAYNLVLQDSRLLSFSPKGIEVKLAPRSGKLTSLP